jgi:hypothetical protein
VKIVLARVKLLRRLSLKGRTTTAAATAKGRIAAAAATAPLSGSQLISVCL